MLYPNKQMNIYKVFSTKSVLNQFIGIKICGFHVIIIQTIVFMAYYIRFCAWIFSISYELNDIVLNKIFILKILITA